MDRKQRNVLVSLVVIGLVYFLVFILPNATGARDQNMISVFEPDEYAQYEHPIRMLTPGKTPAESLRRFLAYQHYYYGFPFYSYSAVLVLLPVKLLIGLDQTAINMLLWRQFVSVLPMILAIILLVYLQTCFRSYLSALTLFVFLLLIPAVVKNNLWWHPDSLTILFIVLTFFFLDRDKLNFGKNFYLAAFFCGLAAGTKLLGLFFFLTIPVYIVWGIVKHHIDVKRALTVSGLFVGIMLITIIASNPMLLASQGRSDIINIQTKQASAMAFGWFVAYSKGPLSWVPIITKFYGEWLFLCVSFGALIFACTSGSRRLFNILILTWSIPFAGYILFFISIKPVHFFLPIAIPVFSSLVTISQMLGGKWRIRQEEAGRGRRMFMMGLGVAFLLIVGHQFYRNATLGLSLYMEAFRREKTSESIRFFHQLEENIFNKTPPDKSLLIYRDVRVYLPPSSSWDIEINWKPVEYDYIKRLNPDLIVLWRQRILDYSLEGILKDPISYSEMKPVYDFYTDAKEGNVKGYVLLYENSFGVVFGQEDLARGYFP